jgi:hypothetical protein
MSSDVSLSAYDSGLPWASCVHSPILFRMRQLALALFSRLSSTQPMHIPATVKQAPRKKLRANLVKPPVAVDRTIVGFALRWRALIAVLIGGCIYPSVGSCESVQSLWSYAHPNARSLIGMDVSRIRKSALGRSLEEQFLPNLAKTVPGIDLLDQVDRVLISSPGSKNAEDTEEPPILVAVRGRFDLARVRQILREHGAKPQMFNSVTVYRPQSKATKEFGVAIIDAQTILVGDAQSIFSTIERLQLPPCERTNALFSRAEGLDSEYDFWVLMPAPGALASQRLPFAGFVQGLRGLEAGIAMREGLSVNVSILAITESKARELKDQLEKLLKLVAKDEATRPELALIAKRPKLNVQGSRVALSIRIDQKELESSLRSLQARSTPQVPVPSKPQRQVIRIEGLDGGTRELVLGQNR